MPTKMIGFAVVGLVIALSAWQIVCVAQSSASDDKTDRKDFEFDVTQIIDAKYLGDTPSIIGRGGNVRGRPGLSLDDSVYRDKEDVGYITAVNWDRPKQSLEIEFSPRPLKKVAAGDHVWVRFKNND